MGSRGRLAVAQANAQLISKLIDRDVFLGGYCFVLTNPSEIIAGLISKKTATTKVFALGLGADFRRYRNIFNALGLANSISTDFLLLAIVQASSFWLQKNFKHPIFRRNKS